jgi:hypothetical protein
MRNRLQDFLISMLDHEGEGLGEEEVANKDTRFVAPTGICGFATPAEFGTVHHIVVKQRGRVDEFHEAGHGDMTMPGVAAQSRGEKEQDGSEAFSATEKEVLSDGRDDGNARAEVPPELEIDLFEISFDQVEHPFQRRGLTIVEVKGLNDRFHTMFYYPTFYCHVKVFFES